MLTQWPEDDGMGIFHHRHMTWSEKDLLAGSLQLPLTRNRKRFLPTNIESMISPRAASLPA